MEDGLLKLYQNNECFRYGNITACLFIGREGEYGEYPSEPFLEYMELDIGGFDELLYDSYIYKNLSLRDIAYMVMYSYLEDEYEYTVDCGSFNMIVRSEGSYKGFKIYINIPLSAFIGRCMLRYCYKDISQVVNKIFNLYKDTGVSECLKRKIN
jgi:hypothetical protein|nr:MAG TPA: hypothetical protein [Caudoviricetes sp.]